MFRELYIECAIEEIEGVNRDRIEKKREI